ncbi:MAG: 2-C-methyl-D-erythritol 2,4-cyclodiphosphate synthase [Balneolaceae bacterium]|nr:2-C-methyl-D-erythritol 2,4-cyclodiphosphate synthase [Balneolaceae bacterium]
MLFKTGLGYDVHAFEEGQKLILGGIEIPHSKGLKGHSDADVLLHAISDALLGAVALGDIGYHFPDTDPGYKGADSKVLLKKCYTLVREAGYRLGNVDATVVAESPKLSPYISDMRKSIAEVLDCDQKVVSVKATTSEKMGFVGREQGVAVMATVLVYSSQEG